jgi:hypothetical protein
MDVCRDCCVLSGRRVCDKLITRPEESYWQWGVVVCDLEIRRPWPTWGCCAKNKQTISLTDLVIAGGDVCYCLGKADWTTDQVRSSTAIKWLIHADMWIQQVWVSQMTVYMQLRVSVIWLWNYSLNPQNEVLRVLPPLKPIIMSVRRVRKLSAGSMTKTWFLSVIRRTTCFGNLSRITQRPALKTQNENNICTNMS